MPSQTCAHIEAISAVKQAKRRECQECVKIGGTWVHLRACQECGGTSTEPGERWLYCYQDDQFADY